MQKFFVSSTLADQKITAPVTSLNTEEQQNPVNVIAPTRRSDRIAARKARAPQQQAANDQGATDHQNNDTMPTSSDVLGDAVGDHIIDHDTDLQQTINNEVKIDEFEQ